MNSALPAEDSFEFDRDVAATPTGEQDGWAVYELHLSDGWRVGGGLNGGYLLAVVANAVRTHLGPAKPDPVTMSCFYATAAVAGPAQVRVRTRREGGSMSTVAAELWQGDALRITTLGSFADLDRITSGSDVERITAAEPELPAPQECPSTESAPERLKQTSPMFGRFELRMHPDHAGWTVGEPGRNGVFTGWYRLRDGREQDVLSLLQVLDALPPLTFDLGLPGWAPTLELTAHIRARPAPGWVKVSHATRNLAGGMFEEDCEVWDSTGRLVAQSRQLARLPR